MPVENFESEGLEKIPDLKIAQWAFELQSEKTTPSMQNKLKENIMEEIENNSMGPYYKYLSSMSSITLDNDLLKKMEEKNAETLKSIEEKIKDAENSLGDTEVREAMILKAHHFSRIGDKENTLKTFDTILSKTLMPGARLDCIFHLIRVGFFFDDRNLIIKNIEKANKIIEEGGDWDRRNRLKVYRGLYSMSIREFENASKHFMDAVATFTSYELMDYQTFIIYTVLTSMIAMKRPDLREKVVRGSEVQEVLHSLPNVKGYLMSLFECQYEEFFVYLTGIEQFFLKDRFLSPHTRYYIREMRIAAYSQRLNSYSSLNMASMAQSFGVSEEFLDSELSRFISLGRLPCKIDKVSGVVETNRPDTVNYQYQSMIKHGDVLLNRLQKLSQVINI